MDADAAALQRFTEVPYVIEAPASAGRLPAAAAVAMAKPGLKVGIDAKGLSPERYHALLGDLRSLIQRDLSHEGGYRIDVFDRSAKDLRKEGTSIDRSLKGFARNLRGEAGEGAFAWPYGRKEGMGCVITGFPASLNVQAFLSAPLGDSPAETRGIGAEEFHWMTLRHELGHCLLGNSEVSADAFAALLALRDGKLDRDQVAVFAAFRESVEWTSPNPADPYFNSPVLWAVVERADALRADERFRSLSTEGVARLARSMSERHSLTPQQVEAAQKTRRALLAALDLPHHTVSEGGHRRKVGLRDWLRANSDVPELARLRDVMRNLAEGAKPLPPFRYDLAALSAHLGAKAKAGDPTAAAMRRTLAPALKAEPAHEDFTDGIPYARGAGEAGPLEETVEASAPAFGMR